MLQWDIPAVVVFNKMDAYKEEFDINFERDRLLPLGIESYEISAKNDDYLPLYLENGKKELIEKLEGKNSIFFRSVRRW